MTVVPTPSDFGDMESPMVPPLQARHTLKEK
jgi:hypothetical protein